LSSIAVVFAIVSSLSGRAWAVPATYSHGIQGTTLGGPHAITAIVQGSTVLQFTYDTNGDLRTVRRNGVTTRTITSSVIRKPRVISESAGGSTDFFYTTTGRKIATRHADGRVNLFVESHLWFTNDQPRFQYGEDAETSADGSEIQFFLRDQLGTVVASLGATGVRERLETLPYGESWFREHVGVPLERGFNGSLNEGSAYDYRARHYVPEMGVFLQSDTVVPEATSIGFNRYTYVGNNPVNFTDPTGRSAVWVTMLDKYLTMPDKFVSILPGFLEGPFRDHFPAGENGGVQLPGMGHTGVMVINDETGRVDYFEFGPYEPEKIGLVRQLERDLPNLERGKDGQWTQDSLTRVFSTLAAELYGQETAVGPGPGRLHGFWFEGGDYEAMMNFATNYARAGDPDRARYAVYATNCADFASRTISAGGFHAPYPVRLFNPLMGPTIYWPIAMSENLTNRLMFREVNYHPIQGFSLEAAPNPSNQSLPSFWSMR